MSHAFSRRCSEGARAFCHLWTGKAGWQDWTVAEFAFNNDLIVVTNNRRDFLKEYAGMELHPGLVVIVPKGDRPKQIGWFSAIVDFLLAVGEPPINKLIEIDAGGRISIEAWPAATA